MTRRHDAEVCGLHGRPTVDSLYADDDENDLFFLRRALALLHRPHLLQTVNDGVAAIEKLKRAVPELLLLDVKMPSCERLRGSRMAACAAAAVGPHSGLMLSSSPQPQDFAEAERLKATGYFVKPAGHQDTDAFAQGLLAFLAQPAAARKGDCPMPAAAARFRTDPPKAVENTSPAERRSARAFFRGSTSRIRSGTDPV